MNKEGSSTDLLKVTVLGPLGTYSHEAAYQKFGNFVEYEEQRTITDVFRALSPSKPFGVVPQENTIFGNVIETYDVLRATFSAYIRGEVTLKVSHCLLVRKGATLSDIEVVMSHEQALGQCQGYISANLPFARTMKTPSTAAAAKALLQSPANCAAICSKICATLYDGLEVLAEGVQDNSINYTRFYIIAYSKDIPDALASSEKKALICISQPLSPPCVSHNPRPNILDFLTIMRLYITRLDRRPSLDTMPFRDLYFIEVQSNVEGQLDADWEEEVEAAVLRVAASQCEVNVRGIW